jgi:hypothetical protein
VEAGAVVGPVINSCTEGGVESAAFAILPFKVAVSDGLANVVGVNEAVSAQTPPTATRDGKVPFNVQSVEAAAARLKSVESVWLTEVNCAGRLPDSSRVTFCGAETGVRNDTRPCVRVSSRMPPPEPV